MDNDTKLSMLLETIGEGVDVDFAQQVLAANGWDLQAAINVILGDGAQAGSSGAPPGSVVNAEGYRAPMRTGYMETLMATDEEQEAEREAERLRLEAERERQRQAAAEAHKKGLANAAADQRREAERLAMERRQKQKRAEEEERRRREVAARKREESDDEDLDSIPVVSGMSSLASLSAELSGKKPAPAAEEKSPPASAAESPQPAPAAPPPPADRQEQPSQAEQPAAASEDVATMPALPAGSPSGAKATDAMVQALVALRKRYREEDPAALATCLRTLNAYLGNLAKNPQEPKFQRISCENSAFRTRVANLEGAVAVLEAVGFHEDGSSLVIDADFARTQSRRLWDSLGKLDVMIEQLKSAGF